MYIYVVVYIHTYIHKHTVKSKFEEYQQFLTLNFI